MGLFDLGREVITEYKADISDQKAKLKELEGAERERAEQELESMKAQNEHADSWLEKMGKVTLALGAVREIGEIAFEGYNEKIKEARLETAAYGIDIEKLGEAAGGLKTNMELLEFAAKANKSAFHNSQEDMEMAERAMRALEARGYSTAEAQDAVTKAVVEGKTKGLVPFGIQVDTHIESLKALGEENLTLAQKTEIHTNAMAQLKIIADGVSDSQDNVGDSMKRAEVSLSNAWAELKKSIGGLVEAMKPLIESFAWVLSHAGDIAKGVASVISPMYQLAKYTSVLDSAPDELNPFMRYKFEGGYHEADIFSRAQNQIADANTPGYGQRAGDALGDIARRFYVNPDDVTVDNYKWSENKGAAKRDAEAERRAQIYGAGHDLLGQLGGNYISGISTDTSDIEQSGGLVPIYGKGGKIVGWAPRAAGPGVSLGAAAGSNEGDFLNEGLTASFNKTSAEENRRAINAATAGDRYQGMLDRKGESMLEKTFGKVGEFDLYKKGFEALTGAVGTMYDALISGSESAGTAFKKFIAGSVAAVGKQMAIEAVKEGAYAIGSLAIGNVAGAASHATAAAEFAAGAVLAGVVANELGYGSTSTSSGKGSGASSGASAGSSSSSSGTSKSNNANGGPIIVYGDSFAQDSARFRQQRARQLVNQVLGTSGVEFS